MSLTAGTRIGPYGILESIGAIKVMGELVAGTPESRERFERLPTSIDVAVNWFEQLRAITPAK